MILKTQTALLLSLTVFLILLFVVPGEFIPVNLGNTILTVSTFLFGIIAGFFIVVTTTDYNTLKSLLAEETAGWSTLYRNVLIYDKKASQILSQLIDEYIRRMFDYEIIDSTKETAHEFNKIREFMTALPINKELLSIYVETLETMSDINKSRQKLIVLGTRALSKFQWFILVILASLVIVSLYGLRSGELFFNVTTVLISSAIVLILFLIRDLDLYIWNEKTFGYDIFENLLVSIGQLTYYPIESIKKGRTHPTEKEYRVGVFVDYPKSLERKIEIRSTDKS